MYILYPANTDAPQKELTTIRGEKGFDMSEPLSSLNAMYDMAILGVRFAPSFQAGVIGEFSSWEMTCFVLFNMINALFAIVCIILLVRLLMAMMTNTFQGVRQSAALECRLLVTRHVLKHELFMQAFASRKLHPRVYAGTKDRLDGMFQPHAMAHASSFHG